MPQQQAKLIIVKGPISRKSIPLANSPVTIGRDESSSIGIREVAVSRQHAKITRIDTQYFVTDLHSKNGTFVNNSVLEPEKPYRLAHGDRIGIAGDVAILQFEDSQVTVSISLDTETKPYLAAGPRIGIVIDAEKRDVWVDGKLLNPPLSLHQFMFLSLLYRNPGNVFDRDAIAAHIWTVAQAETISEEMIDALVSRVRRRIREVSAGPECIVTVRGHGFKFVQRK